MLQQLWIDINLSQPWVKHNCWTSKVPLLSYWIKKVCQLLYQKLPNIDNYYNSVLFRAPDWLIDVTWFNHKKLTDSLFPKIERYKPHYTKNRKLTDLGACSRCANYDVTMYCDAKHNVTMRCLHQLEACISRSHWQIKEMANSLFS